MAQWPNIPLWIWIAASTISWSVDPGGRWATALSVTGTAALTIWAVDEILRGVNPWRRILGAVVLISVAVALLTAV